MNFKDVNKYEKFYASNSYGLMEILSSTPNKFKVRFIDSGFERWAEKGNVLAGKVKDTSVKSSLCHDWQDWDEPFINNSGHSGIIYKKKAKLCIVKFDNTSYTTEAHIANVRAGKILDPYEPSVLGLGFLGEFEKVPYWKRAKQLWSNIMKRCYNPKDTRGYYGRAFVDERWYCFANFLIDLPKLENFDKWLNSTDIIYNLDKDLKICGNKIYSKDTCMFITERENKSAGAVNGRLLDKQKGRYD